MNSFDNKECVIVNSNNNNDNNNDHDNVNILKTIAFNIVNESYNKDPNTKQIRNTNFIEREWLDEYEHLDCKKLVKTLKKIHIYYPTQDISYTFNGELMIHIMENYRIPTIIKKYSSSIMGYLFGNKVEMFDKKWGYIFYIFTSDYIFYADGIKNERGNYFNMIPLK